jgi:hypothetical protein
MPRTQAQKRGLLEPTPASYAFSSSPVAVIRELYKKMQMTTVDGGKIVTVPGDAGHGKSPGAALK